MKPFEVFTAEMVQGDCVKPGYEQVLADRLNRILNEKGTRVMSPASKSEVWIESTGTEGFKRESLLLPPRRICDHEWGIDGMHSNEFCKKCMVSK